MLTFRQKIFFSYFLAYLFFLGMTIPFASKGASAIMYRSMEDRADEIIDFLKEYPNEVTMIQSLKEKKPLLVSRVTLINDEGIVLYDTHTKRLVEGTDLKEKPLTQKEVISAFNKGIGYHEAYSNLLQQDYAYMAKTFRSNGKKYVLRISFPLRYIQLITRDFRIGSQVILSLMLLFFSLFTSFVINHLTKPIDTITKAITPYQEGKEAMLGKIELPESTVSDEFVRLARTLNLLSDQIDQQIRHLVQERREKELVLESLAEGVVAVDPKGQVTYANVQACKFFNADHQEELFLHQATKIQQRASFLLNECQIENMALHETLEMVAEGGKKYYNLIALPMKGKDGAVLVIQDQTSQLRMIEMKRDFVANASHELRTPITVIQGFAETLQQPTLSPLRITMITEKIISNCQKMTEMIQELLLLADVEHLPASKLEKVAIEEVIQKCQEQLLQLYPDGQCQVYSQGKTELICVPFLLERALMNVMDNGLKYSPEHQKIIITISEKLQHIEISVKDEGIGMNQEDLEHMFNRFYRSSRARSKMFRGSGLGLAIVESILHKHHGTIYVTSEVDVGTEVVMTLPKGLHV